MRSLTLGDCTHYKSPYMRGVAQAMRLLDHPHAEVSIRLPAKTIEQRLRLWKPDVIWTHMLMWPPTGAPPVPQLIEIVTAAARRGARVIIHDGDARSATRYPHNLSAWCSLALVNHAYDRSAWGVPALHWPYFAPVQDKIAKPVHAFRCELFFAGILGGGLYAKRTALIEALRGRVSLKTPTPGDNTIDRTAEIAASADAVLGFGRPDIPGWVDTRVFQYIPAGGILLHDDAGGFFEPWNHFIPYQSGDVDSVIDALGRLRAMSADEKMTIRRRGFAHGQANHSSLVRVSQVIRTLGMS